MQKSQKTLAAGSQSAHVALAWEGYEVINLSVKTPPASCHRHCLKTSAQGISGGGSIPRPTRRNNEKLASALKDINESLLDTKYLFYTLMGEVPYS